MNRTPEPSLREALLRHLPTGALALLLAAGSVAVAQPSSTFIDEPQARGTSYFVFAEPGAPTFEVVVLGEGIRNGVYRLQEGTSLIKALALMGGTAQSDSTDSAVATAFIRVFREAGDHYDMVYEASPEALLSNVSSHPVLRDGDSIEVTVNREDLDPFTFRDGVEVASRVASLLSVAILIVSRL